VNNRHGSSVNVLDLFFTRRRCGRWFVECKNGGIVVIRIKRFVTVKLAFVGFHSGHERVFTRWEVSRLLDESKFGWRGMWRHRRT
jgi:hypothetical protein